MCYRTDMITITPTILDAYDSRGMSQADAAASIGMSAKNLYYLESGYVRQHGRPARPSLQQLQAMATEWQCEFVVTITPERET